MNEESFGKFVNNLNKMYEEAHKMIQNMSDEELLELLELLEKRLNDPNAPESLKESVKQYVYNLIEERKNKQSN